MKRSRKVYFLLLLITIAVGLFSRTIFVSGFVTSYVGDYLYSILIFLIFGFIFTKTNPYKILIITLLFCCGIEFLQLYQPKSPNWLSFIRSYKISRLFLGNNFQLNDIVSYTFGAITGYVFEVLFYFKNYK